MSAVGRDAIDAVVKAAILGGARRFSAVRAQISATYTMLEIDRSLQRLRRRGLIAYESATGWRVVTKVVKVPDKVVGDGGGGEQRDVP